MKNADICNRGAEAVGEGRMIREDSTLAPFFLFKRCKYANGGEHNKYKERGRGGEKGGKGSKHASVQRRWSERERDRERELWEQAVRQSSAGEGGKCERECV